MTDDARRILREAGLVWAGSLLVCGVFGLLGLAVPLVAENLLALVAAGFLFLPAWALWRRNVDLADYGLRAEPIGRGLLVFSLVTIVVMPAFVYGHHLWQRHAFGRAPEVSRATLVRFAEELDDAPELPLRGEALHVWIQGKDAVVFWSGEGRVDVTVTADAPLRGLVGWRQTAQGTLLAGGLFGARVSRDGPLAWAHDGPGGLGFSVADVTSFRVETSAPEIRRGHYEVRGTPPLEASRSRWWWLLMFGSQLVLVAVPEEWFFRGYLQQRLDEALPPRWRLFGAPLGWGWLASSAMFAIGHLVLDPRPQRLAVFFPSLLFGWMMARTGSVMASSLFHALCNVAIHALGYAYILKA